MEPPLITAFASGHVVDKQNTFATVLTAKLKRNG